MAIFFGVLFLLSLVVLTCGFLGIELSIILMLIEALSKKKYPHLAMAAMKWIMPVAFATMMLSAVVLYNLMVS